MKRGFFKTKKAKAGAGLFGAAAPSLTQVKIPKSRDDPECLWRLFEESYCPEPTGPRYYTIPENPSRGEVLTECFIEPERLEMLKKIPGFPRAPQPPQETMFRAAPSSGKGQGLFATRAIKQGELLLDERPLLFSARVVPIIYPLWLSAEEFQAVGEKAKRESIETMVARMRPERRATFMSLANTEVNNPIGGIHDTNCAGIGDSELNFTQESTVEYSAVCEYISRINHSCSPNTQRFFDKTTFSWRLYAVRDIADGEELTFMYSALYKPAAERKTVLDQYHFTCTCAACMDAPSSDARRAALLELDFNVPLLLKWAEDRSLPDDWLLEKCNKQLELLEVEGLEGTEQYWEVFATLMRVYLCFGNIEMARKWAARADSCHWLHPRRSDAAEVLDVLSTKYEQQSIWRLRAAETA